MDSNLLNSDTDLVDLLISGDERSFDVIYRKYAEDLYRYARKNIDSKEDCEEIIQDIFESLWSRHDQLGHVTELKAYLFRMVKYKIIRYFQHNTVKKRYAEHYKLFEAVYDTASSEERDNETLQHLIENGLKKLPERCQLAVRLRLNENLSNSDIAKRMNIKKSTVENYMVTAVSHLRGTFQNLKMS